MLSNKETIGYLYKSKKKYRWEIREELNATEYFLNTKSEPSMTSIQIKVSDMNTLVDSL